MTLYIIAVTFVGLLLWAGFAKVDEITRGEGKVIPSQQMQVIQSVDGGVVEKVYVQEGEHVKKGDLLIRIDPDTVHLKFKMKLMPRFLPCKPKLDV